MQATSIARKFPPPYGATERVSQRRQSASISQSLYQGRVLDSEGRRHVHRDRAVITNRNPNGSRQAVIGRPTLCSIGNRENLK
jgi:hypothetical protein